MKRLIPFMLTLSLSIGGALASAQDFRELIPDSKKDVKKCSDGIRKSASEDADFTVTLNVDFDTRMMRLEETIWIFGGDERIFFEDFSRSDNEILIPMNGGTYDFIVMLADRYKRMTILTAYDVKVDQDISISLSAEDATEVITFNPIMPDGSPLSPEFYDEDQYTVLDRGNAWDLSTQSFFGSNRHGRFFDYTSYEMRWMYDGEEVYIGNREIRTMPNSGLYLDRVYQSFNADGATIIYIPVDEFKTATLSNDISNYAVLDEEYQPSPFERPSEYGDGVTPYDKSRGFSAYYWMPGDRNSFGGIGSTVINEDFEKRMISVCQPKVARRQIWPVLRFNEWDAVTTKSWPIDPLTNKVLAMNTAGFGGFSYPYLANDQDWYPLEEECVNDYLSFELGNTHRWGEGVPVAITKTTERVADSFGKARYGFTFSYSGNMGEERTIDLETVEPVIKINDTPATDSQINEIAQNQLPANATISWEYTNTNISPIEGISPYNSARTEISTKSSDHQAPTVQALRFHDENGMPALSFQKPEDGYMMLYAGDFLFHQINFSGWYSFNETPDLTLEYRPNGEEGFKKMECNEDPDKFFMPGFGACFTAGLAQVNVASLNKWYDLRITLKDQAGNSQQQILSPAFRIESVDTSGIAEISSLGSAPFDIYSAQGMLVVKSADKSVLHTLPSGLYIISGKKILIP